MKVASTVPWSPGIDSKELKNEPSAGKAIRRGSARVSFSSCGPEAPAGGLAGARAALCAFDRAAARAQRLRMRRAASDAELEGEAWSTAVPVVIAANRLPVRVHRCEDEVAAAGGEVFVSRGGGGEGHTAALDSASSGRWRVEWAGDRVIEAQNTFSHHEISARANIKFVGRVGDLEVPEEDQPEVERLLRQFNCFPVFVAADEAKLYYEDYCKQTLWPTFHNVVDVYSPVDVVVDAGSGHEDSPVPCWNPELQKLAWQAYANVNQLFANVRYCFCTSLLCAHLHH